MTEPPAERVPKHMGEELLAPCDACGRPVSREAVSCPNCGHPISPPQVQSVPRQPSHGLYVTCLVLAIASVFLGGTFGLLAWGTALSGVVALVREPPNHRQRWMAWTALGSGIAFSLVNAAMRGYLG